MEHKTLPHPTIIKKMKTFLEVEGKMGPIPQPASSQYRPSQPDTNPNVRKDNTVEKRKWLAPTKRFRLSAAPKPNESAMQMVDNCFKSSSQCQTLNRCFRE